jgi:glutamate racemase
MPEVIGIFDSGLGGLTVLKQLKKAHPSKKFLYLSDSKRSPYGTKSDDSIQAIAKSCVDFLYSKGASQVIIACHTASLVAYECLSKQTHKTLIPMHLVTLKQLESLPKNSSLHIMGTESTVKNGFYQNTLKSLRPDLQITTIGCPLLVEYIQNQFDDPRLLNEILSHYASEQKNCDFVLLACTHFPILQNPIAQFFGHKSKIIDPAVFIPNLLEKELTLDAIEDDFFVTKSPVDFNHFASKLFLRPIISKYVSLEDYVKI